MLTFVAEKDNNPFPYELFDILEITIKQLEILHL